jgi:hypothetical protein
MGTWSIADTHARIASRFGAEQRDLALPSLYAMAQRQLFARYHFQELQRLLTEFQRLHLTNEPLLVVVHGQDEKARSSFQTLMIETGAHALACVLSIHAIADVTSFAVFRALGYDHRTCPLRERDVTARKLQALLRSTPGHNGIADLLAKLLDDADYIHVAALANHSKHQGLVKPILNEDLTGKRPQRHELRFAAFQHGTNRYPERELTSLLEPACSLASTTVVEVGNQINTLLAPDAV